ncbi:MAG: hypothetical protein JSW27_21105 [Phycisphaerales bacterium]|nr:MAG: hypothetical protein JSW27_21105 [Phycisphaerales bacterium]
MRYVLKASEVKLAGPLQLCLDPDPAPQAAASSVASAPATIRIAETHPEYALMEVTCSCGKITYVRCEYAPAPA